jgi:hypothetical protein
MDRRFDVSHRKVTIISFLALVMLLGTSGIVQADPPVPGEDSSTGSSLNETLSFNNLGAIMSGSNDVDDIDDGPDDQNSGDDADGPDGDPQQHPVASALAAFFFAKIPDEMAYEDVNALYDEIMALHEAGNGFGTITKAYFFADKFDPPLTPQELLEKARGTGWGNILKDGDIHPGSVGNGAAHSNRPEHAGRPGDDAAKDGPPGQVKKDTETDTGATNLAGPGGSNSHNGQNNENRNNNGNGNNKGVNGRPDDNGGGPGNNGNNGNNGNSRGNGKDNGRGNK